MRDTPAFGMRIQPQWYRCRAISAHIRQSRPDSGLGVQIKVLKALRVVPSSLRKLEGSSANLRARTVDGARHACVRHAHFISQRVLIKLFCTSRFPHTSVNISFISEESVHGVVRESTPAKRLDEHLLSDKTECDGGIRVRLSPRGKSVECHFSSHQVVREKGTPGASGAGWCRGGFEQSVLDLSTTSQKCEAVPRRART